jgi:hypothetical protein
MKTWTLLLLLAFCTTAGAQEFTDLLWPPRDQGAYESFSLTNTGSALDGKMLAVLDDRRFGSTFVRVYQREGLNWIEDGRLTPEPPSPRGESLFGRALDVDGERVVVGSNDVVHVFRRFGARNWGHRSLFSPVPTWSDSYGRSVSLSDVWLAVADLRAVYLYHLDLGAWSLAQTLSASVPFVELDGANLLLVESHRVQVYRCGGSAWVLELGLRSPDTFPEADLDGDRLGLLHENVLQFYERNGASWQQTVAVPVVADTLTLSGTRAYLSEFPDSLHVLEQRGFAWVPAGMLSAPDPALSPWLGPVSASGPLVVVAASAGSTEYLYGQITTFSTGGERATLRADHLRMALEDGGTLTLTLDAGPENAGKAFFLGGSLSGTSPGMRVLGVRIPLNERGDPYARFSRVKGRLDGSGRAAVRVELPPIAPGEPLAFLRNRTLHHAFVLYEPRRGITHVSNVALTALVARSP